MVLTPVEEKGREGERHRGKKGERESKICRDKVGSDAVSIKASINHMKSSEMAFQSGPEFWERLGFIPLYQMFIE